ncbi:MAG: endonuclease MutS2 [Ruminococcaceae bacterium]|nr:endonuclease MutS2 [Oscillospiraceae bacterium]
MKYGIEKYSKTLELDKILEFLANETAMQDAADLARETIPSTDIKTVEELLKQTKTAHEFLSRYSSPHFSSAVNVSSPLTRAYAGAALSMAELLEIAATLRVIRSLKEWRAECIAMRDTAIDWLFDSLVPNKYIEEKITFAIKSADEMNDNASSTLYDIRRKIAAKSSKMRDILDKIVKGPSSKYLQEAIITQRDGRFVVPLKAEHKGQISGIVHDTSATGSTIFIEPMSVVETNNEIRVLKASEQEEIARILAALSAEAGEFADSIIASYKAVVQLNLIFAKAQLGYKMKAIAPEINNKGEIYLKNARHPLIHYKSVVPITVGLGREYNTLVITGPNTGGKTVTLKTVGLLTLMTMCGLMIPADDGSHIAIFTKVFADIGDEQSIEQSLSTFSSHMTNIISILENADDNSLVLFDELCAGTDPVEGAALAKAILIRLAAFGAKVVATTHYPELKAYAIDTERVENASCEFDVSTLKPTYKLIIGMPGRSNAFAISKKLGLDDGIIQTAKEQISDEDRKFERTVEALENAKRSAEEEHKKVSKLRARLEEEKKKAEQGARQLEANREKLMEKTRQTANDIIEAARYKSGLLLNELEELKKGLTSENAISMAERARRAYKTTLNELEETANPVVKKTVSGERVESLNKGDIVVVADIGRDATVIDVKPQKKQAYVMSGSIKMWVDFGNLVYKSKTAESTENKKTRRVTGLMSRAQREVSGEVDLRGMASDEALLELDRYIDNSLVSGLESIRIIHGKGTGVLRKSVQDYLRHHKSVKTFRLGTFGEGENGVTIAELK